MRFRANRIFISYSSRDKELAESLVVALRRHGAAPFLDSDPRSGLEPGVEWKIRLSQKLHQADSLLLVITNNWRDSPWCQAEYRTAVLLRKRIISLVVGDTPHNDIESDRQKVFLKVAPSNLDEVVKVIVRNLPTRRASPLTIALLVVLSMIFFGLGVDRAQFRDWDLIAARGGVFRHLAKDVERPGLLYATASEQFGKRAVLESRDFGATWKTLPLPLLKGDPARVYSDSEELLVASDGALLRFDRGSEQWQQLDLGGLSKDFLFAEPVWSANAKQSQLVWGTIKPGGVSFGAAFAIIAGGQSDREIYATSSKEGGFGIQRDDGTAEYLSFQVNDAAFHPRQQNIFVGAAPNEDRLLITRDAGRTFQNVAGFAGDKPLDVLITDDGKVLLAACRNGLWMADVPKWDALEFSFRQVTHDADDAGCLAQDDKHVYYGNSRGLFSASKDRYEFAEYHTQPPVRHINAVLPVAGKLLVATGGGGVFELNAEGRVWRQVASSGAMLTSCVLATDDFTLLCGGAWLYLGSTLSGDLRLVHDFPTNIFTILRLNQPLALLDQARARSTKSRAAYAYEESSLWAATGKGLFRKTPGSVEWKLVNEIPAELITSLAQSGGEKPAIGVVADHRLFLSVDQGSTWQEQSEEPASRYVSLHPDATGGFLVSRYAPSTDGRSEAGAVFQISRDGKRTLPLGGFENQRVITGWSAKIGSPVILAATLEGVILVCNANGSNVRTLSRLPIKETTWIEIRATDEGIYCGCEEGRMFESHDQGASFQPLEADGGFTKCYGIAIGTRGDPQFLTNEGVLVRAHDYRIRTAGGAYRWSLQTALDRLWKTP